MLAPCLARDPRFKRAAQELAHSRQAEQAVGHRRPVRRRALDQDRPCGALKLLCRHQPVNQPALQHAIGTQGFAGEHQFHRLTHPQQAHGAYGAPKARMYAKQHFRQAHRQAAVIRRNAIATRQGQLESAAQRET